jgi:hypothetical protein
VFSTEDGGPIPPPLCDRGYLIVWVIDQSGNPIKYDALLGDAVLREAPTAVTAYDAIAIQAGTNLAVGALTDLNHNGSLDFNGSEYKQTTNKIYGSVHYNVAGTATVGAVSTSLVLLTLDTRSNDLNYPVNVGLNYYNEIEALRSGSTLFFCWGERRVAPSSDFGIKGLVESTRANKTAILGFSDKTGPVTLLGLVLTRESALDSSAARHYIYPLYHDKPLNTAFVP